MHKEQLQLANNRLKYVEQERDQLREKYAKAERDRVIEVEKFTNQAVKNTMNLLMNSRRDPAAKEGVSQQ